MKEFVKMMLAVICAFIVMQIVGFLLFFVMIGSVAALGSGKTVLPREGVLDINLSQFQLGEQTIDESLSPSFSLLGLSAGGPTVGLWDAVQAIEAAAADPGIKYILLRPDGASGSISSLEELRAALAEFRQSGKAVVSYTEAPNNASYYLASVSDKIYMTSYHGGSPMMVGISSRMLFLKDILDKVGVNYQLIRHGKYKSAGEMYIKNAPSAENREQYQVMVNSIWKSLSSTIAASRDLTEEQFNDLIDNLKLNFPEDFLQYGLVDELLDHEGLVSKACSLAQVEKVEDLHLVPLADYVSAKVLNLPGRENVAILFADGEIIDGNEKTEVASDRFVRRPPRELPGRQRRRFREDPHRAEAPDGREASGGLLRQLRGIRRLLDFRRGAEDLFRRDLPHRLHRRVLHDSRVLQDGRESGRERRYRGLQQAQRHVLPDASLRRRGGCEHAALCGGYL